MKVEENNIFKVLADKGRREVLVLLKDGAMSAGEIAQRLGCSPSALSYHLKLLKSADLVTETRKGTSIYYEINSPVLYELILWVRQFG